MSNENRAETLGWLIGEIMDKSGYLSIPLTSMVSSDR